KNDIILAGVGGQGILTIAAIIGKAAMKAGLNVKQSEVHGMAQRGGAVLAHLRLSDKPIFSDLIAEHSADVILAVEPMEALRHVTGLADTGAIIVNSTPIKNIADYPETDDIIAEIKKHPKSVVLDADSIAVESGSARAMNIVMLGAVSVFLDMDQELLKEVIRESFLRKGEEIVVLNLKAFEAGRAAAK
ncbi:MAG: indolepyruvate oxidoreductase subunit beta, partial [Victivallales bacterium]|nr:indolepyruvate oxidoreductase subunit beta [Victivallales bacterium]